MIRAHTDWCCAKGCPNFDEKHVDGYTADGEEIGLRDCDGTCVCEADEWNALTAEVERLREEDADRREQMASLAFTAPDADWDAMFLSLEARTQGWVLAEAAVQAVLALHKPVPGSHGLGSPYQYCSCEGITVPWPCRTIRALEGSDA